jgi:ATP-dependent helicase HrpB
MMPAIMADLCQTPVVFRPDLDRFPADALLPELLETLSTRATAIVVAPPGTGKTTRLPLGVYDHRAEFSPAILPANSRIIVTEPRRIAARNAAERMAASRNERVGELVGYRTRDDTRISSSTRIEVVTEGVFLRMLQNDPGLSDVCAVMLDEIHERHLATDLALTLTRNAQALLRPDLRIVVLSATLDDARLVDLLDAPVHRIAARMFAITQRWQPTLQAELANGAADAVVEVLGETVGDVLVFAPGSREIRHVERSLSRRSLGTNVAIRSLSGSLSRDEQQAAFATHDPSQRRVTLATAIAQTSITLPGVRSVIDLGLTRSPAFDQQTGLSRLLTRRCAKATAIQRSGRAGRLGPGLSVRLWSELEFNRSPMFETPEILDADLSTLVLTLAVWGVTEPTDLHWLDIPPSPAWETSVALLQKLGLLKTNGQPTQVGREAEKTAVAPRLAAMVLRSAHLSSRTSERACALAAVLSNTQEANDKQPLALQVSSLVDTPVERNARGPARERDRLLGLVQSYASEHPANREDVETGQGLDVTVTRDLDVTVDSESSLHDVSIGGLLSLTYPERIAVRSPTDAGRYQLASGGYARINDDDPLRGQKFLVAAELDGDTKSGRIHTGVVVPESELRALHGERIVQEREVRLDTNAMNAKNSDPQVRVDVVERLDGAEISRESSVPTKAERLSARTLALTDEVLTDALTRIDGLLTRLRILHTKNAFTVFPTVTSLLNERAAWIDLLLDGDSIEEAVLCYYERERYDIRRLLSLDAPLEFILPNGRRLAIDYAASAGPTVRSRLQDFFSLTTHPRIGDGTVALVVELLSPAGRPTAVTSDLQSFWKGGYLAVRAELRGRYPKHSWPQDPSVPELK